MGDPGSPKQQRFHLLSVCSYSVWESLLALLGGLAAFPYMESPGPQLQVRSTICGRDSVAGDVGELANLVEGEEWPVLARKTPQHLWLWG